MHNVYPPRRTIWQRYRSRHPVTQATIGCLVLVIALFACMLATGGLPEFVQGVQRGFRQNYVSPNQVATQDALARPSPGGPQIGGKLDNFIGQYGAPTTTTPDHVVFVYDGAQITAYTSGQIVTSVGVAGPSSWRLGDTVAFCRQFLPDDATEFTIATSTPAFIDYHSSLGQVVMQLQPPTCSLFIAPSSLP